MPKSIIFAKDNYYEAIIQLRPYDEEVFLFIKKEIKKRKDNVYMTKIVYLKEGTDVYISSQKFARTLGPKIKKRFDGELKMTRTIHTRNRLKSRNVYRATILFRRKYKEKEEDSEN
ncbi:MAG: hypothetical protein ISS01_02750 [Nanoarchaeota archaeon]|nr:hypothetical protein [Nanoarchaeota archaeon]